MALADAGMFLDYIDQLEEVKPTPATHAILTGLKAGETVYETDKVP